MFRTILISLALATCTAGPAIAQVHLVPGATLDGGSTRTLDLAGVGSDCGNLAADLSSKTLTCAGNSSTNRLTNVDNVLGPLAKVPFQAIGNDDANYLVDRNGMSVLRGRGGNDTLVASSPSIELWGGEGADLLTSPTRITKVAGYYPINPATGRRYTAKTAKAAGVAKVPGRTVTTTSVRDFSAAQGDKLAR